MTKIQGLNTPMATGARKVIKVYLVGCLQDNREWWGLGASYRLLTLPKAICIQFPRGSTALAI